MQLIFIHGSGGCKESWQFQTQYFDKSEAINLPGHPDGDLCPTIEGYTNWVRQYIQSKNYREVVLVGHSLGGGIALQYALDYPEERYLFTTFSRVIPAWDLTPTIILIKILQHCFLRFPRHFQTSFYCKKHFPCGFLYI